MVHHMSQTKTQTTCGQTQRIWVWATLICFWQQIRVGPQGSYDGAGNTWLCQEPLEDHIGFRLQALEASDVTAEAFKLVQLCWDKGSMPPMLKHLRASCWSNFPREARKCLLARQTTLSISFRRISQEKNWENWSRCSKTTDSSRFLV